MEDGNWRNSIDAEAITASLSIARYRELTVQSNEVDINVVEISITGIKFKCDLKFPISDQLILKFNTSLFNRKFTLYGSILERRLLENGRYIYTVEFVSELEKEAFDRLITNMGSILEMKCQQEHAYFH